jgi:hypothetical protein
MSTVSLLVRASDGGAAQLNFSARRLLLAGFTGRDQKTAMKHVEELRDYGVVAPKKIPSFYAVPNHLVSTATELEVLGRKTSGEVEPVLLIQRGQTYVGVGSDHTDREVEKTSIANSKVMCGKILAPEVWSYRDVKDHWDELLLRSWIGHSRKKTLYQQAPLGTFIRPEKLIRLARSYVRGGNLDGTVLFLGTVPITGSGFGFAEIFRGELIDKARNRQLRFSYRVKPMNWLKGDF